MKYLIPSIILMLVSCGQPAAGEKEIPEKEEEIVNVKDTLHEYVSGGNDQAEIRLTLRSNDTFNLYMRILPELGTEGPEEVILSYGTWKKNKKYARLTFLTDRPVLHTIFSNEDNPKNTFKIINDSVVDVNTTKKDFFMWGILCSDEQR